MLTSETLEMDIVAMPVAADVDLVPSAPDAVQRAPAAPILIVEEAGERREPVYARIVDPTYSAPDWSAVTNPYRVTAFTSFEAEIDPQLFYEPAYDQVLVRLVAHVLRFEAPISEDLLVQRIARAHGFQRAGRIIRDRVMEIAARQHFVEEETSGCRFVWALPEDRETWDRARAPASMDDIRLIEDISLAEIRAARHGRDAVEVARVFGVRRLSAAARERIEAA